MIAAFARAGQVLDEPEYLAAAQKAGDFILEKLVKEDGRLLKRYRQGHAGLTAHLEDYAFMIWGLLDLYEITFDTKYFKKAIELQKMTDEFFWDPKNKGYFMTATDAEKLIVRAKKLYGGAIPGGNSVSMINLARLYRMTADKAYQQRNEELISAFSGDVMQNPMVYPVVLCGLDFHFGPTHEIVIAGKRGSDDVQAMLDSIQAPFLPNKVVLFRDDSDSGESIVKLAPFTREQKSKDGKATAFICQDFTCQLPTTSIKKVEQSLKKK